MNNLSRRTILLLLAYVLTAITLTVVMICQSSEDETPASPAYREPGKPSDKLGPNELYFADRNYPSGEANPKVYRDKLMASMAFDRVMATQGRDLDYPWTIEGPGNIGGRVNTIAVHPVDPNIILIGFSQGGIYRTEDAGQTWKPVFDDQASLAISHIIFSPHDHSHLWATTGDVNISGYPFIGSGIYQSTDGGKTWSYSGLEQKGVLSKVIVDPNNPEIIYAGSMGYPSHKGDERGVFRSTDGGASWQKTLTIDDSTGVIDMVADPTKPGRIFASGWKRIRSSKISSSLGPGTSLYRSEDYGATWTNLVNDLPAGEHSRTSVEITNDGTLFVSYLGEITSGECFGYIESLQNIYTSLDGGNHWDTIPTAPEHGLYCDLFGQFGWYFEVLKVNPQNPLDMFLLGVDIMRTLDGGLTWFEAAPPWWFYDVHADKHDLVFAHGQLYLGTDGGAYMTDINPFGEWVDIENIPSTQFYRTTFNPHLPDQYFGGAQDNGTSGGNKAMFNEWPRIFGGDGFQPLFDPDEPSWLYVLVQNGVPYFTEDGFQFDLLTDGLQGSRYWDMPFVMSPHDPKILFCGSHSVFRMDMRDTIREWKLISGDLTRKETILSGRYPAITAIAQSELDALRLYAGTQDGMLWTSGDGGESWVDITEGTPGFYVTSITCSTINPTGVIATYSGYRDNDHQPYIFRSEDAGTTWEPIQADLPMMGVNSFYILPGWNDAVLFAATDGGVYVSQNAGGEWKRVGSGMPYTPVYDLDYNPEQNTLVAATFSRGLMTFPIEELDLVSSTNEGGVATDNAFEIYPTCVENKLFVVPSGKNAGRNVYNVHLYSMNGVRVGYQKANGLEGCSLDIPSSLESGTYLVSIEQADRLYHQLIVKL